MDVGLLLRSLFFVALFPGTVTVWLPGWMLARRGVRLPDWGLLQAVAVVPLALGLGVFVWCVWEFASFGRGTLAPVDPPKKLVVRGLYRYVRNPMYVGVLLILVAEACFFATLLLAVYAAAVFVMFNLFIVFHEEPALRQSFGEAYVRYCARVGRWFPRGLGAADRG